MLFPIFGSPLHEWSKKYRTEILIFLVAFSIRGLYALIVQYLAGPHGFIAFSDAEFFYYRLATNLVNGHGYSLAANAPYLPEAYHTPLYPFFISLFLLVKLPLISVAFAQALLGALTAVFAFRIARIVSSSYHIAVGTALLMALEPMSVFWSSLLMSDVLFAFLFTVSFYLLALKRSTSSLLVLGLATLTRPIALYFAPVFIAFMIYDQYVQGYLPRRVVKNVAIVSMTFVLVISPWLVRNKLVFGQASLTSASWYIIYILPLAEFTSDNGVALPNALPQLPLDRQHERFSFEYEEGYRQAFFEALDGDVIGFAHVYLRRALYSFVSDRYEYLVTGVLATELSHLHVVIPDWALESTLLLGQLFWLSIHLLALAAVVVSRYRPWWTFAAVLIELNALLSGAVNPVGTDMSRYSLALYPLLFLFAGIALRWVWQRFKV